jgi:hypothetical protein
VARGNGGITAEIDVPQGGLEGIITTQGGRFGGWGFYLAKGKPVFTGTPVDDADYQVPFRFTGKLAKLTLKIDRPKLSPADEKRLMEESRRNNRASE